MKGDYIVEFRNFLQSKRNSTNFNELNEAVKSRKIDPRNWLSPVDEKLHNEFVEKLSTNYRKLGLKFPLKPKADW